MKKSGRMLLIEARKHRKLSQQEVADQIGTTQNNVSRWELGLTAPSPYFRAKLRDLFGKSAQELELLEKPMVEEQQPSAFTLSPVPDSLHSAIPVAEQSMPLWHVPYPRNPFFTGREDLLYTLNEQLNHECRLALSQSWAISGLGGIGKTQIALEYAYQYRQDYHSVFWISAASREILLAGMVSIADFLQLPEKNEQDQNKIMQAVKHWLVTHQGWLLILDNADDISVVQDMASPEHSGHLLLTTRAQALGSLAQRLEVETMGMAEGTLFLLRRAKLLAPDALLDHAPAEHLTSAEAIVIEMDFLPLALDQAGAYIEEVGCSLTSYLELYRAYRTNLLRRRGHIVSDHPEPVATTWSLNFQQVEQANLAAADLLRLCAFLEPDAIPEELFREGNMFLPAALQQTATNDLALNDAIEELRAFSLIRRDPESRLLRMHRLVQAVLRDSMEEEERRQWAERAVRATNAAFPKTAELATWSLCRRYLPHTQMCSVWIEEFALASTEATSLLSRTASYLLDVALYEQAESLYQRALCIGEQMQEPERPLVADILDKLALLYHHLGKYEQAEPLFQRALCIQEQMWGPDHPDVAHLLNNLAILFYRQGKYEQAEPFYQRALHIQEQTQGLEHPKVAGVLNGLAVLYGTQGKYEQAELLYQRALRIWEQHLGSEHLQIARLLNNLAILYYDQEKHEQAELLYRRALRIWEQHLGPEHPNVAHALNNLAELYQKQRKYEQAKLLYQRALRIWEQVQGPDLPNVAYPLHGLAVVYAEQGKYGEAEQLYQRALQIREHSLGLWHPVTAETLHDFAILQETQGNLREAASLYQRSLTIREQVFGAQHTKTLETCTAYDALLQRLTKDQPSKAHDSLATDNQPERVGNGAGSNGEGRSDILIMPPCPHCHSHAAVSKNGTNRSGTQRFRCRSCSRSFTPHIQQQGHNPALKDQAVALKAQGNSDRAIARMLGVDHHTVRRWAQAAQTEQ